MKVKGGCTLMNKNVKIACIVYAITGIITALITFMQAVSTTYFFDNFVDNITVSSLVLLVGIVTPIIMSSIDWYLCQKLELVLGNYIQIKVSDKISKFNPYYFEDSKFLIKAKGVTDNVDGCVQFIISVIELLTLYLPYFVILSVYLYNIESSLVFILILIIVPVGISFFMRDKIYVASNDDIRKYKKKSDYFAGLLSTREYVAETRLLGAFEMIFNKYSDNHDKYSDKLVENESKGAKFLVFSKVIKAVCYGIIMIQLVVLLIDVRISVATFIAIFTILQTMFNLMEEVFNRQLVSVSNNRIHIKNMSEILKEDIKDININCNDNDSIQLKDVTFAYGENKPVLNNINLNIKRGEVIAIVGENGSGKTTLSKILLGLYPINTGSIKYYEDYKCSTVMQEFNKYEATLRDNITFGEVVSDKFNKLIDVFGVKKIGIDENTRLGKMFGERELSKGQWQKIAIIRGLYRDSNFVVFDEPSAAIDPLEEKAIYDNMFKFIEGVTTVVITHRLGSIKFADKIVYMEKGEIVEQGGFEELINKGGKFSELYKLQATWFE